MKNGEIVDADNVYVNDKAVTSENVHEGDIIVVVRNGSRALIGKHAQIKASMPNTVIGAFMSGMRSEHSSFVNALLDTSAFENEIAKNMGATINQITGYMFSKMEFMIPSGDEQQKIGEHFQSLDNLITLHQRITPYFLKINAFVWEQRKLGDSCKLNGRIGFRGYTEKDIISKEAGGVLTFSPTNIVDNKLTIECKNTYITREKYDESPEIKISNGDILFVKTGSTLGKSALVAGLKEDASINPQIVVMHVEKDTENFMSNVLITDRVMKQVAAVKIGGAVPTMTETELKNFTYFAPAEKEEKKKIGDHFRTLDNLITLHQRKPYFWNKFIVIDWEQRKLGDLVDRVTRKNQDLVSELPLTISAQYGLIDQNEFFDKRVASKDVSGYYLIENGEFAYNKSTSTDAPWGAIKRLDRYENGVLSTLYIVFGIKANNPIDSDFLVSYYSTNLWHKGIHEIAAEGARNHGLLNIAPADFFETKLMIPQDIEEQKKIGKYFEELERLITLHQRKPIPHPNHPIIHTKHKGEEKYVRIRVNDREKTNRTANLRRFSVDISGGFKN